MNYAPNPGKGGVLPIVASTVTGATAITTLPTTGGNMANDVAIALAASLVVWAVMYLRLRRKTQV